MRGQQPFPDTSTGVSEVIGTVLLISLVVLSVAIIAMLVLSQATPQRIPNVNFMTGSDAFNNLYLYHNGGDSLTRGSFTVRVDDTLRSDYAISDGSNEWALGKNLILANVPSGPHSVALIYNGTSGGAIVLRSATSDIVNSTSGKVSDPIVTVTYPPVVSVPQLMQNVTNNSIDFYRESGTIIQAGYLQFNVTQPNSSVVASLTFVELKGGDVVRITPKTTGQVSMRVFAIGDQIWELTADKADIAITNRTVPLSYTDIQVNHTWINGYKDIQSTLTLSTAIPPGTSYTELAINRYPSAAQFQTFSGQVINRTSSDAIVISNVRPLSTGLFVLQFDNRSRSTYFVGSASGYSIT